MDSARCLSRSLKSHNLIDRLSLAHCDLGSSPEILSVLLQSDITYIDLTTTISTHWELSKLPSILRVIHPFSIFILTTTRLNDDDAVLISQALKRNTNLRRIDLRSNNFTRMV